MRYGAAGEDSSADYPTGGSLVSAPPVAVDYEALTSDGGVVRIRTASPEDGASLRALHERVSDDNLYLRFFSTNRSAAAAYAEGLVAQQQTEGHVVLVAEAGDQIVAVAAYESTAPGEAEVAFLVDDPEHGRGIGTLLLEQLVVLARDRGIKRLVADTLSSNALMLRVFADSGLVTERHVSGGVVDFALDTASNPASVAGADERERLAEERSLGPLIAPRSVAVIGAGRRPGGVGHEILRSIIDGGFTGRVFAVNPHASMVGGVPTYPSIADVPEGVDLAVVAVAASRVPDVVTECAAAGVRGAIVVTSGLAEVGGEGVELQRRMVYEARRRGMRVIGPNCLGLANTDPQVRLNATFASVQPHPGALALASQSGAVGIAVLSHATRRGIGLSEFVSLGNKADISGNDLLLHWWQHQGTRVIALYLESFGNPRKFGRLARRVGRHKPVLVVKAGRSPGGRRAGASHTAAAANSDTAVRALFAQAGVLQAETLPELLDMAQVLVGQPLPGGDRLGIVGNAGGAGVLAADAAASAGLTVPSLSEQTRKLLRAVAPGCADDGNPVDLGAAASAEVLGRAVDIVAGCGELDALVVVFVETRVSGAAAAAEAAQQALEAHGIPAALVVLGAAGTQTPGNAALPRFDFPEPAVRAVGRAAEYARWRRQPEGSVPRLVDIDLAAAEAAAAGFIREHPEGSWLDVEDAALLLGHGGVPLAPGEVVGNVADALQAAKRLGYPVVLKAADPQMVHKTEHGAVRTSIGNAAQLSEAFVAVSAAYRNGGGPVLVQRMAAPGVEMAVGVVHEPPFGPILMLGAGGVLTDILDDRAWRILPLTDLDAEAMVGSLKSSALLRGFRGGPVADSAALLDVLHRVAQLADAVPEIAELDLNPVIVSTEGAVVVDAKIRLTQRPAEPDPYVRRLR